MEIVAMATDLAEFLGAALGFHLLLGLPLGISGLLTAVVTFLLLSLERQGFRRLELVIALLVATIAVSYLAELFLAQPDWKQVAFHSVVPAFGGKKGVLLASGILGATIMPHVIFLHSALTQGRIVATGLDEKKRLLRYQTLDVVLAMGVAGAINGAMLIMAACAFHARGLVNVDAIEEAHLTLQPLLGSAAGMFFAIALLAAGLSSSAVGTMAGQVIMQGFLEFRIPLWVRRGVTMAPALVVIGLGVDPTWTLVLSQVVLSFALPFALVPLVVFSSRKSLMGSLVNRPATTAVVTGIATLIFALNFYLLWKTLFGS
jgi:manganese transport protein